MKTKIVGIVLLSFILIATLMQAQSAHNDLRIGDDEYDKENYAVAEEMYRNAVVKEPSAQAKFNLGNTLFQQERFEEASKEFQQAVNLSNDTVFRAKALYNKGNSLLQQGDLAESLKSYKRSLLLNPNDEDAKRNYMLAMQKQQEQEQQQQNEEENKDQDNEEQQQNNQDSNPPPDEGDQEEQNEEQKQQEEQNEQKEESKPKPEDSEMNREEAEQLLQIIENTDSYVQKKIKKQNSTKKQGEKNW